MEKKAIVDSLKKIRSLTFKCSYDKHYVPIQKAKGICVDLWGTNPTITFLLEPGNTTLLKFHELFIRQTYIKNWKEMKENKVFLIFKQ